MKAIQSICRSIVNNTSRVISKDTLIWLPVFAMLLIYSCVSQSAITPSNRNIDLSNILIEGGCGDTTSVVKKAVKLTGVVYYNTYDKVYQIIYHIPGTYDSQDIGFVCNLPADLQKSGSQITFDGDYLKLDRPVITPQTGGQNFYYLKLTRVVSFLNQTK